MLIPLNGCARRQSQRSSQTFVNPIGAAEIHSSSERICYMTTTIHAAINFRACMQLMCVEENSEQKMPTVKHGDSSIELWDAFL